MYSPLRPVIKMRQRLFPNVTKTKQKITGREKLKIEKLKTFRKRLKRNFGESL